MKFVVDENVPRPVIDALRAAGNEVASIQETSPAVNDDRVLRKMTAAAVLITLDKDLAARARGSTAGGVILIRRRASSPRKFADELARIIASRDDWLGSFSVVEEHALRMTPQRRT